MFLPLVKVGREKSKNLRFLKPQKLNSSHLKQNRTLPLEVQVQKTTNKKHLILRRAVSEAIPCWTASTTRKSSRGSSRLLLPPGETPVNPKKRLNKKILIKILRKCDSQGRKTRSRSKQRRNRNRRWRRWKRVRSPRSLSCSEISGRMTMAGLCGTLSIYLSSTIRSQAEISLYKNLSLKSRAGTALKCSPLHKSSNYPLPITQKPK